MIRFFCHVLLLTTLSWTVYAGGNDDNWNFKVYLDDKPVGFHNFTVDGKSKERKLKSTARFDVDFFIFNAYSYQHESNERWDGNCVDEINATTNDNGEKISVHGKAEPVNFRLTTNKSQSELPACVMTFAYWNPEMLEQKRLLNPQDGKYLDVEITQIGSDTIKVRGENVSAAHYRLKAEKFLIDLWYSADRRWLALDSTLENGRLLRYRLE
ncbi:MAG: DUF6134 family protein [Proteobacteria bacterium]|nr:DUF6134 family protein [Pseudomonadota bacterium]